MKTETIKQKIISAGVYQWQVAKEARISEATFTRWMREENIPENHAEQLCSAIERLVERKAGYRKCFQLIYTYFLL